MYVPSLVLISVVLSKIWPEQATIMKNKWLWGGLCFLCSALPLTAIYL